MTDLISVFKNELAEETVTTRKMLSIIPEDRWDWKPHPKSSAMGKLASHIAELPQWIALAITRNGLDFAKGEFTPNHLEDKTKLMKFFENSYEIGESHLRPEFEKDLDQIWILRNGEHVIRKYTKAEVIRMVMSQIIHHRAQLGMYLRLLDIPIPGSYGPSADER